MSENLANSEIIPIKWNESKALVEIIDQTKLPYECIWEEIKSYAEMAHAIKAMLVRGAPLIGISAAYGLVLALQTYIEENDKLAEKKSQSTLTEQFNTAYQELAATRPTAVNLHWALELMKQKFEDLLSKEENHEEIYQTLLNKAKWIQEDDLSRCKQMGEHGVNKIKEDLRNTLKERKINILTHCNAGALATGGYGTALGVIRRLHEENLLNMTYSDETRPRQQGSRLTVWELAQEGIPVTMNADTMSGFLMQSGKIDAIVVGSDRIAVNGDVANKIGTYQLAILDQYHNIPFYVIAPESTIDFNIKSGSEIPIEYRSGLELSHINDRACTFVKSEDSSEYSKSAIEVKYINPGFDVTPNHLISGIITEKGLRELPLESLESDKHLSSLS